MIERVLSCDEVETHGLAAKYAAGRLDAASVEPFEEHLLLCASCQETVRMAVAVRRADPPSGTRRAFSTNPLSVRSALLATAAVVVIGAGIVVVMSRTHESGVRTLGLLDRAPAYQGLAVRSASSASDSAFVGAMKDYAAGAYASAADRLGRLVARGEGGAPALFFRGASLLMLDRPAPARDAFTAVIDGAPSPYGGEAWYYRAVAAFRVGDSNAAMADLRAIPADDPVFARARGLLEKVEAQRSR